MSETYDFKQMTSDLISLLRLKTNPIGIQVLEKEGDIEKIPKCRTLKDNEFFTPCQLFGQSMSLGLTYAMTKNHIPVLNCEGINGMCPQSEEWHEGAAQVGVWYATPADSRARQDNCPYLPYGKYEAIVSSPLESGKIEPDVCMVLGQPVQIFYLVAGYVRHGYAPLDTPIAGESNCSNHWMRTIMTGKPNVSLPSFAEMRFANYPQDSLISTWTPEQMQKAIDGVKELFKIGLKYPIPGWGEMHGNGSIWGKGK